MKTIVEKYKYCGLYVGAKVLVYTVELEGVPATIKTINEYGNIVVMFNDIQRSDDDERTPYSGQNVHPRQVEPIA
jgi:hypothetical protein